MLLHKAIFRPGQPGESPEKATGIFLGYSFSGFLLKVTLLARLADTEDELDPPPGLKG